MSSDWKLISLEELTERGSSITYGVVQPGERDPGGVLFIRGGDIANGEIQSAQLRTISSSVSDQYKRTLLKGGELVVSLVGNPGQVAIVPPSLAGANIARQVGLVRLNPGVDPRFVKYYLLSRQGQAALGAQSKGSVQQVINLRDLKNVKVPVPGLGEQRAIADILEAFDDKIELNRRMNATLEAMARALFKAWFVDFEPVHANKENRPSTSASPEIAKLFPSTFENGIPKGWEEKPLAELLQFTIGGDWGTDEETEKNTSQVCIVRGTDIPSIKSGNFETAPIRFVQSSKLQKRELVDGDIVIEVSGGSRDQATGRSLYFTDKLLENFQHKAVPASFCRLFRGINSEAALLVGVYLQNLYDEDGTWEYQTQSTGISNFQTTHFLSSAKISLSKNPELLRAFYKLVRPMVEKQQSGESAKLKEIRDSLLPRLISGKLQITM